MRAKREGFLQCFVISAKRGNESTPLELQPVAPFERVEMRVAAFVSNRQSKLRLDSMKRFVSQQHTTLVFVFR